MGKRSRKKTTSAAPLKDAKPVLINAPELSRCVRELGFLTSKSFFGEQNVKSTFLEVEKLVSNVVSLQSTLRTPVTDLKLHQRPLALLSLRDWVKQNDGNVGSVSIADYGPLGFGLQSLVETERDSIVCSIPRKVMMTLENAEASELGILISTDLLLKQMSNIALALFLLLELAKDSKSFWTPYLSSLPRSYDTILYFNCDEFSALKGSPVQEAAMSQYMHIARQYSYFYDVLQKSKEPALRQLYEVFTYESYRWAVSTVLTRINLIPSSDESRMIPALIPMWDLCNHDYGPITTGFNCETNCGECFALHSLQKGDQVLISYGKRPNSEFFIHNGFVPDENPDDRYKLHLGLSRADPVQQLRANLLEKLSVPCGGNFYLHAGPDPIDGDLLAFIRVFCMDKGDIEHWVESGRWNDLKCMDCALDTRIEAKTWTFLSTRINLLLSTYPKTSAVEESNPKLVLVQKLIVSETKVLQAAFEYARLKGHTKFATGGKGILVQQLIRQPKF